MNQGKGRIYQIFYEICDIFLRYEVTEKEVNEIVKVAGNEYILSLKKRLKIIKTPE